MEALGVTAIATVCDVVKPEDRARLIERTETELGQIDILVNNAGIERVRRFEEASEADFTDTLSINLEAPILLTRAVVPGMLARKRGHVVNIAPGLMPRLLKLFGYSGVFERVMDAEQAQ